MSDLNRRVAEALGIRIRKLNDGVDGELCYDPCGKWLDEWIVLPSGECAPVPDWAHDLNTAHEVIASVLSYRIEHQYTLGGVQGGLMLIIEGVAFPEVRQRIATLDEAAPYLLERWLEIHTAHVAWKGQGDTEAGT